jgi:hypothetical protein
VVVTAVRRLMTRTSAWRLLCRAVLGPDPSTSLRAGLRGARPYTILANYLAALKVMGTSALSASSTLNMGRGVRFMKLATKVSGIC